MKEHELTARVRKALKEGGYGGDVSTLRIKGEVSSRITNAGRGASEYLGRRLRNEARTVFEDMRTGTVTVIWRD